jgi:hypothetical protein
MNEIFGSTRYDRLPASPEVQPNAIVLQAGAPVTDALGRTRFPIHGSILLPLYEPARKSVVMAVRDGTSEVYTALLDFGDGPPLRDPPQPLAPGALLGGWFNFELRGDLGLPAQGGRFHVSVCCGPFRSAVLTLDVPPVEAA